MSFRIVVLAKQVPDTRNVGKDAMKEDGTINRAALPAIYNPEDLNALEMAIEMKERIKDAEIVVVTMGPGRAAEIVRESMYRGADGGCLISDMKFAGADTLATSYTLSMALRKLSPYNVLICGRQAIDGDTAQVGPETAELLDLPQVSYVEGVEYDGQKTLEVRKQTEEGYQIWEVQLPCLLTVLASANKARYMSVRGIVTAFDREVEIWSADDVQADPATLGLNGSPTRVKKSFTKGAKSAGKVFEVDANEAADLIISKLKEKYII